MCERLFILRSKHSLRSYIFVTFSHVIDLFFLFYMMLKLHTTFISPIYGCKNLSPILAKLPLITSNLMSLLISLLLFLCLKLWSEFEKTPVFDSQFLLGNSVLIFFVEFCTFSGAMKALLNTTSYDGVTILNFARVFLSLH
ncbi:hypothetical protein VNO77_39352 [Canavalia gladiata]|uniref:Uncharacterized protein n=1 Tax=Canavalia gladiata TaxID=3824 RepID=A0AAN9KAB1_CANGL